MYETITYHNGKLKLDNPLKTKKPIKVTITYEDEVLSSLKLSDFSFIEAQVLLKDCHTSFSNEVIEERRNDL